MEVVLSSVHRRVRALPALHRLAVVCRILLAIGFIPPALVKIQGHRFTSGVDLADPIVAFFEAMYQTGAYWRFLGWAQLAAGVCLLVPQLMTLGAVMFLPIIVNILVITLALHFTGTPAVVGVMLLADLYLIFWDFDRFKSVIWPQANSSDMRMPAGVPAHWSKLERSGYLIGTGAGLGAFLWTRGLLPQLLIIPCLFAAIAAAGMVLLAWLRVLRSRAT